MSAIRDILEKFGTEIARSVGVDRDERLSVIDDALNTAEAEILELIKGVVGEDEPIVNDGMTNNSPIFTRNVLRNEQRERLSQL